MAVDVVSEQTFEQNVLRSELPVLVEFFANWCAPCKQIAPDLEALAIELEGKVRVVKIDADVSVQLCEMLRVKSLPTFVVFAGGRPVNGKVGALKKAQMQALVEPYIPRPHGSLLAAELAQLLREGHVVPVDTREAVNYQRARIPGAKHIPLEEIETRLAELHMLGGDPVLYCRGGDKTKELSERMAKAGDPVAYLEGGFLAWEGSGLDVERPD